MKTVLTIAPPPPARRHRLLPVEPLVFAVLLMALTLGINVALPKAEAGASADTAQKAQPAQTASPAQLAHSTQIN